MERCGQIMLMWEYCNQTRGEGDLKGVVNENCQFSGSSM